MKLKVHNVMLVAKSQAICICNIIYSPYEVVQHFIYVHEWNCGCCKHEPLTGPSTSRDGKVLEYFSQYEPAFKALQKLVMDKQWLKSMKYYVRFWSVANCSVIIVLRVW